MFALVLKEKKSMHLIEMLSSFFQYSVFINQMHFIYMDIFGIFTSIFFL